MFSAVLLNATFRERHFMDWIYSTQIINLVIHLANLGGGLYTHLVGLTLGYSVPLFSILIHNLFMN